MCWDDILQVVSIAVIVVMLVASMIAFVSGSPMIIVGAAVGLALPSVVANGVELVLACWLARQISLAIIAKCAAIIVMMAAVAVAAGIAIISVGHVPLMWASAVASVVAFSFIAYSLVLSRYECSEI